MPVILKILQKIEEEGIFTNTFYKPSIILISKPDKNITRKRKLQTNISYESRCKNPQQNTKPPQNQQHEKYYIPLSGGIISAMKGVSTYGTQFV